MDKRKLLKRIISNTKNVKFDDFVSLIESFGFVFDRMNGSHHIFKQTNIQELINLQNVHGEVKPYQIKQFLFLIEKYNLEMKEEK